MRNAVLKILCLAAVAGCEAGAPAAPAATPTAREEIEAVAVRAETALTDRAGSAEIPSCRAGERPIYACDFGDRRVAVCAADRRLSYRFGDARRTDLEIDSRPGRVRAHAGGVVGGGGGHQNYIRFSNNGYQYIVHSMEAGSLTDVPGKRFSGVTVLRGEDGGAPVVRTLECPQDGPGQIIRAAEALPDGAWTPDEDESFAAWW